MKLQFTIGKNLYQVQLEKSGERYQVTVNGKSFDVSVVQDGFSIGGKVHNVRIRSSQGEAVRADVDGKAIEALILDVAKTSAKKNEYIAPMKPSAPAVRRRGGKTIMAPMPGKIVKVLVKVGQKMRVGDVVLILEAMKMENEIRSPFEGEVKEVFASAGEGVAAEDPLIRIE